MAQGYPKENVIRYKSANPGEIERERGGRHGRAREGMNLRNTP